MSNLVVLLLFLGVSSFIKKIIEESRKQRQNVQPAGKPESSGSGPRKRRVLTDASARLAGIEPEDGPEPQTGYIYPGDDIIGRYEPFIRPGAAGAGNVPAVRQTAKAGAGIHVRRHLTTATLRQGILLKEILGPCRALCPYGSGDRK